MTKFFGSSVSGLVAAGVFVSTSLLAEIHPDFVTRVAGTNGASWLVQCGVTNSSLRTAIQEAAAAGSEAALVDALLSSPSAAGLFKPAFAAAGFGKLSPDSQTKFREAVRAAAVAGGPAFPTLVSFLPKEERQEYRARIYEIRSVVAQTEPLRSALFIDFGILDDIGVYSTAVPIRRHLEALFAAEPSVKGFCENIRKSLASRLAPAALAKFAKERRSYVTKDGKNPLAEAIAPALAALNAPLCAGLEKELRDLGIDAGPDIDRGPLQAYGDSLVEKLWSGKILLDGELDRLVVVLGVDGFNDLKAKYNGEK